MGHSIRKHPSVAVVVEQDQEQRAMAVVLLEETEVDVIECGTAEDALKTMDNAMAADRIALAFVNMRLPGRMDGVEFAQVVKRQRPNVHVIVTSRKPGRRIEDLPEGAVHMAKPWLPLDLLIHAARARANRLPR
jgi:DNA-binding NtrC family response regulator